MTRLISKLPSLKEEHSISNADIAYTYSCFNFPGFLEYQCPTCFNSLDINLKIIILISSNNGKNVVNN